MPPVVNAHTSDLVHAGLCRLLDENYRHELSAAGRAWYEKYHSNKLIAACFSRAISDVLVATEERRLHDTVRELRDTAAICRELQERQAAGDRVVLSEVHNERNVSGDVQSSLDAIHRELEEIRDQLCVTAATVNQIGLMIPNMLRAQRFARLILGPPFWLARFVYRHTRRGPASRGASEVI